jgi:hypothetical protein
MEKTIIGKIFLFVWVITLLLAIIIAIYVPQNYYNDLQNFCEEKGFENYRHSNDELICENYSEEGFIEDNRVISKRHFSEWRISRE